MGAAGTESSCSAEPAQPVSAPWARGDSEHLTVLVHGRVLEVPPHLVQGQALGMGLPRAAI